MYLYEGMEKYLNKIDDHVFSIKELRDITHKLIKYIEIEDYFSKIRFNVKDTFDLASYNFLTKEIKFQYNYLCQIGDEDFNTSSLNKGKIAFINLTLLQSLFHEILHAIQNYIAFDTDWPLAPLLKLDIVYFNNHTVSDVDYDRYHDLFLIEREANATAIENILCIIKRYIKDDELYNYFKDRLHGFMIACYKREGNEIISPMEFIYEELYGLEPPCVHNMELYDRIKLGFKISLEEYKEFIEKEDMIILAKNNLN